MENEDEALNINKEDKNTGAINIDFGRFRKGRRKQPKEEQKIKEPVKEPEEEIMDAEDIEVPVSKPKKKNKEEPRKEKEEDRMPGREEAERVANKFMNEARYMDSDLGAVVNMVKQGNFNSAKVLLDKMEERVTDMNGYITQLSDLMAGEQR